MSKSEKNKGVEMLSTRSRYHARQSGIRSSVVLLFAGLLLLQSGSAWAWNSNYGLCFPEVINVPGTSGGVSTYLQPPAINGVIDGDTGWTRAWRYSFNNGSYVHDAVVQGIKNNDYLYLSFEVNQDQDLIDTDAIVLAFDPVDPTADATASAAARQLLHVFPLVLDGVASPVLMTYWQGYPWSGGGGAPPAGTEAVATASGGPGNWSWFVELRIPRAAFGIPATGDFGMYFNIVTTSGPVGGPSGGGIDFPWGIATEYPWPLPPDTSLMTVDLMNTPAPTETYWGRATVAATTCNGVFITPADIYTDNVPPNHIKLSYPNVFHAMVHNTSIDGTGAFIPANGISATFKIADFGLGAGPWDALWTTVPADAGSNNPTLPATVNANSTADLTTTWTISAQPDIDHYNAYPHQCILVELNSAASSLPWATVFTNRSAWTNMDFETLSVFESSPKIDPRGWGVTRRGKPTVLDLWVTKQIDQVDREDALRSLEPANGKKDKPKHERRANGSWAGLSKLDYFPAEQDESWQQYKEKLKKHSTRVSQLTYLVNGCAQTGAKVRIKGKEYSICKRVGSYGYVLRHAGAGKAKWKFDLHGPGLTPVRGQEGRYRISLNKPLKLAHRFEATDLPRTRMQKLIDKSNDNRELLLGGAAGGIAIAVYLFMRRRKAA